MASSLQLSLVTVAIMFSSFCFNGATVTASDITTPSNCLVVADPISPFSCNIESAGHESLMVTTSADRAMRMRKIYGVNSNKGNGGRGYTMVNMTVSSGLCTDQGSRTYAVGTRYKKIIIDAATWIVIFLANSALLLYMYQVSSSFTQNGRVELPNGKLEGNEQDDSTDDDDDDDDTDDEAPGDNEPQAFQVAPLRPEYDDDDDDWDGVKLFIVRDGQTGKSTFISRNLDARERILMPGNLYYNNGFAIHDMEFATNIDVDAIHVECIDRRGGYADCYNEVLDLAELIIIMIDVTNMQTLERLEFWINTIYRIAGLGFNPIVIVGNKIDSNERVVEPHMVVARSTLQYYEVSALGNQNYEEPFVYLLQQYFGRPDLRLEVPLRLANPQVLIVPVAAAAAAPPVAPAPFGV